MDHDDTLLDIDRDGSFGAAWNPFGGGWGGSGGGGGDAGKGGNVSGGGGGGTGSGSGGNAGQQFWEGGGAELANTGLAGVFELLRTGILVEQAKKNPEAAALLAQIQAAQNSGGSDAEVQAQLAALAAQNAALLQAMQTPKGPPTGWIVAGVLALGAVATAALVVMTRRTGVRNYLPGDPQTDPSIYDLDRSQWDYVR